MGNEHKGVEKVFWSLVLPRSAAQSCEDDRGVEHGNWREKPGQWIFVWMFAGYSNVVGEELAEGCLSPSLVVFVSKWLDSVGGCLPSNTARVSAPDLNSNPQEYRALCRESKESGSKIETTSTHMRRDFTPSVRGWDHQSKKTASMNLTRRRLAKGRGAVPAGLQRKSAPAGLEKIAPQYSLLGPTKR